MRTVVVDDYAALSQAAADVDRSDACDASRTRSCWSQPATRPWAPTASWPSGTQRGELDSSQLRVAQLDEYAGLAEGDHRSLYGWMVSAFTEPLDVPESRTIRLDGRLPPAIACRDYDAAVAEAGGFDLAVLGLGPNGHLGFNEPPIERDAPTRLVPLTAREPAQQRALLGR